jgi:hypothetical protein
MSKDYTDEYKAFSNLIGVDFRASFFKMFQYEELENKQELYREVHDKSRIFEW